MSNHHAYAAGRFAAVSTRSKLRRVDGTSWLGMTRGGDRWAGPRPGGWRNRRLRALLASLLAALLLALGVVGGAGSGVGCSG